MVHNQDNVRQHFRKSAPMMPALVIGLGKFGREVAAQLAIRLQITEASLRQDGLVGSLLIETDPDGLVRSGLVRVLTLDWDQWFDSGFSPEQLLSQIGHPGIEEMTIGTPPQRREENRHPDDWNQAEQVLSHAADIVLAEARLLREHDLFMRAGFETPAKDFSLPVYVVFAAREADSAVLAPMFISLLGKVFVEQERFTKGLNLFCYVGGTTRAEHQAAGGDEQDYLANWDAEYRRIVSQNQEPGLLEKLETLWKKSKPQTIDICYLLDAELARNLAAVQRRLDEPDEPIVATALALHMLLTTDASHAIQQSLPRRWDLALAESDPGLFASFGAASYAIDHPKLRRLIYNRIIGDFLIRALPRTKGALQPLASPHKALLKKDEDQEALIDPRQEARINHQVGQQLADYHHQLQAHDRAIGQKLAGRIVRLVQKIRHPRTPQPLLGEFKGINFKQVARDMQKCLPDIHQLGEELRKASPKLADEISATGLALRLQNQQEVHAAFLSKAVSERWRLLYDADTGPLFQVFSFVSKALTVLQQQAKDADAPLTRQKERSQKQDFLLDQQSRYERSKKDTLSAIRRDLRQQPTRAGALGRALLIGAAAAAGTQSIAAYWGALPFPLPWIGLALITFLLWEGIYRFHRWLQRRAIQKKLEKLGWQYMLIQAKVDYAAWRWGLTESVMNLEAFARRVAALCKAQGVVAHVREKMLTVEVPDRDRVLERVFLNAPLKEALEKFSNDLAKREKLWKKRAQFLEEVIENGQLLEDAQLLQDQGTAQKRLEEWLLKQTEMLYRDDIEQVADVISGFLEKETDERLMEMWDDLLTAAVPLLRYDQYLQEDPSVPIALFGVHHQYKLEALRALARADNIQVLDTADRLRWTFLRVRAGLHLPGVRFSIESLKGISDDDKP
jgi:hypothetical protein